MTYYKQSVEIIMKKILIILGILICVNLLIITVSKAFATEIQINDIQIQSFLKA